MKTQFQTFAPELRKLGFRKTYSSRAGGGRLDVWERSYNENTEAVIRTVDVQIWSDGRHRASHMISGTCNTYPTNFVDIPGLKNAVEKERTRKDNKFYAGDGE